MNYRKYGEQPIQLALIHGGPGAAGSLSSVAQELSNSLGVFEPFQTGFSIEDQIEELNHLLRNHTRLPVILVGHSWGAWLSVFFAQKHPDLVKKLILVSSAPFEQKYASEISASRLARLSKIDQQVFHSLSLKLEMAPRSEKDEVFLRLGVLLGKADSYKPIHPPNEKLICNYEIFNQVWSQAVDLRKKGCFSSILAGLQCPVAVIHGDYDVHPAIGVKNLLVNNNVDCNFHLLEKCGHHPWNEKFAHKLFYQILLDEIE